MHRGGHLGGHRVPRIKGPQRPFVVVVDPAARQLRDRRQPPRSPDGLGPGAVLDRRDQLGIIDRRELRIEHTFEVDAVSLGRS